MSDDGFVYALKHGGTQIKMVSSAELVETYPEALVAFLERQIKFKFQQSHSLWMNDRDFNDRAYISACTNQGQNGIKYLFSRNGQQFVRVMPSKLAVENEPHLVVEFLESKLDLADCNKPDNKICYGIHLI